ncbi:MAG: S8 family serine peptidase [Phycisphaerales bacterium JB039]
MRRKYTRAMTLLTPVLLAGTAMAGDGALATSVAGGTTRLALVGGAPFHSTDVSIVDQRVVRVGEGLAITWTEVGNGAAQRYFAVSLDGQTIARVAPTDYTVRLRYANFDPMRFVPGIDERVMAPAGHDAYIVQFITQPLEQYSRDIEALGGTVEQFMADHCQIVRMSPEALAEVSKLPYVRWVGAFHPAYKLEEPILQALTLGASDDFTAPKRYSIMTLREGEGSIDPVIDRIRALGARINGEVPETGRLEATMTLDQLLAVAKMSDVMFIDRWGPMETDMDIARMYFGSDYVEGLTGFSGEGVRGEVFDTGVWTAHQEFSHQSIIAHGVLTGESHGTSVASIIFARGARPSARGVIPYGQMIAANSFFDFTNRYRHHGELVDPSGPYRTVFQTNSTGSPRTTTYDTLSAEMDRILFDHDMVVCQSQSNSGTLPSRPQAWSKNMLSVGGFNHKGTLTRADDAHQSTGSTGPAADGRVKPDLSAFYDGIEAASSGTSTYTQFGGTSGATPITCGHVGLLHQMWHEGVFAGFGGAATVFDSRPHMTTPKALLINTAASYPAGFADFDRFDQGWGQVDLKRLYDDRESIFIVDQADIIAPLGVNSYEVTILPTDDDLRITMIYPDLPGAVPSTQHRINDLSLKATSPTGVVWWGNNGLTSGDYQWSDAGGAENNIDTVENIFIQAPEQGPWRIEVIASEINEDGHPATPELDAVYSLVVNGGSVTPPPLTMFISSAVPDVLAPGETAAFTVDIIEGTEQLDGTPQLFYRFDGGTYLAADLTLVSGDTWEAVVPAVSCGDAPEFYVEAKGDGGAVVHAPAAGAAGPLTAVVGVLQTVFSENFEAPSGWTVINEDLLDGAWEVGDPIGWGRGDPDADFDGSGKCYVTDNDPTTSNSDVDGGPTRLISPVIDLSGLNEPVVEYARWFGDLDSDDRFEVDFSDDGGVTWTNVEAVGSAEEWVLQAVRIAQFVTVNDQFRARFSLADNPNGSITEGAVDAFALKAFVCDVGCYADCDESGALDFFDFLCFKNAFGSGDLYADCDGTGTLDFFDFLCFQNAFGAGCP